MKTDRRCPGRAGTRSGPDDERSAALSDHFAWLGHEPLEGSRAEVNLLAPEWMRKVGERIAQGFVLTIDYGYPAEELYAYHRRNGTLMCYHRHQADDNPYDAVGDKDITAHVDFSALQKAGKEAGLDPLWFGEQYRFLLGLGFFEELVRLVLELFKMFLEIRVSDDWREELVKVRAWVNKAERA